ncbi:MAG: hypothetical protein HQM01_01355 [Magnetococcales bacterium]|nr:hypothetical protein [Magnetococcales bacterium]
MRPCDPPGVVAPDSRFATGLASSVRRALALWVILFVVVPVGVAEARFQDDFNRPDSRDLGPGWSHAPNQNDCPQPKSAARKPARAKESAPRSDDEEGNAAPYDDISREIEKKAGKKTGKPAAKKSQSVASDGFQGSRATIRDGMLFFKYAENQDAQMAQREFPRVLTRLSYDFTPLYAMGGTEDRAWIGVRLFYLDANDLILGEIRHFYHQSEFPEKESTTTVHTIAQKGGFDGTPRRADIDAERILEQRLRGVDRKKIVKTRLSFEAATGMCASSVEAQVDNVVASFGEGAEPFRVTRAMLMEIVDAGVERFGKERAGFPGNWKSAVLERYGRQPMTDWLQEFSAELRGDPLRLVDHLGQRYGLTGREAWLAGFSIHQLLSAP